MPGTASLRYIPSGSGAETATVTYRGWDASDAATPGSLVTLSGSGAVGGTTAYSSATDTASLAVSATTDTTVLTPATPSLGETGLSTAKTVSISSFINAGAATTTITVSGTAGGGIAVTAATGSGTWAYSLDGTTFTSLGTVAADSALLLPTTASLRYTPGGTTAATATITYLGWDGTTGQAGSNADTTNNGGTTAFSSVSDTASLQVANLNTAPVLTAVGPSLGTTDIETAKTIALKTFINNGAGTTTITDTTSGAVIGGIAVTGTAGKGAWSYSLNGTTFTAIGAVAGDSALLLPSTASLRYTPDGADAEKATITYRAWDTTTGQAGAKADTTTTGGSTAFSTATDTASLSVAADSLSGYVYLDQDKAGQRINAQGDVAPAWRASWSNSTAKTAAATGSRSPASRRSGPPRTDRTPSSTSARERTKSTLMPRVCSLPAPTTLARWAARRKEPSPAPISCKSN